MTLEKFIKIIFLCISFFLTSCGYKAGVGGKDHFSYGIAVPYVEGDHKGILTSEITYALKKSGLFTQTAKANQLRVKICKDLNQDIGWREDFKNTEDEHRVIVDEKRKILEVEVSICQGEKVLWGPKKIRTFIDYDFFDFDSLNDLSFILNNRRATTLDFSLGQLNAQDSALDSSLSSLYKKLAEKIVEKICLEW